MNVHVIMERYYYPAWERCTLTFNHNTVKNFLNSRLLFNMYLVLCVYIQFKIGSKKGTIRSLKMLISSDILE